MLYLAEYQKEEDTPSAKSPKKEQKHGIINFLLNLFGFART